MIDSAVILFAGQCLEENKYIDVSLLQQYIFEQPNVGKRIDALEIAEVLSLLKENGWLKMVRCEKDQFIYVRRK